MGAARNSVRLDYFDDAAAAATAPAVADGVVGAFAWRHFGGPGSTLASTVAFPATAPASAAVELRLSSHGEAEFWYLSSPVPRTFRVFVDGEEIAYAKGLPYVYAFAGVCCGTLFDTLHGAVWWSGHQALDRAGVHTGNGEIPPYRAEVPAEYLPLLAGSREVKVVQEGPTGFWIASLSFLTRA